MTYKDAGVDIEAGSEVVKRIKKHVKRTFDSNVITDIGGFGGLFNFEKDKYKNPILVSGTDGVGTKLKIAFLMDKHDTVGQDLVAMCVNDIIVSGAKPLFFLDYLATGRVEPKKLEKVVKGIADGCKIAGCALLGGETAEMPDFYQQGEYDLAGFVVGVVDKDKIIDGKNIKAGDVVIGIASSGLHSNGYSLVRKLFFEKMKLKVTDKVKELNATLGEELLKPTKIYAKTILKLIEEFEIKGIAHITGGGLTENMPRILPKGVGVEIIKECQRVPTIFRLIKDNANLDCNEMHKTFNMGIGMALVVNDSDKDKVVKRLKDFGEESLVIGKIVKGETKVSYA
ncbi:phosphoribosylformylglycinamidine cyclo-ligase [Candidatus Woesearchaeota archaeon]|nr:phosphoribosylformylglycinamidine cyclo-ligase [Candidatus Woesearchaeota archaeon]